MNHEISVVVDKAEFLSLGRVFKRVYKPRGSQNVTLTLANNRLRIEFDGGGCELACITAHNLTAEMKAKDFASVIMAHNNDKATGTTELTFRPEFGEFATRLAGGKATFK